MKYLLDTSVFLWALAAVEKLNSKAQELLSNTREDLFLSAASAWEISIKYAIRRLQLPQPPVECVPHVAARTRAIREGCVTLGKVSSWAYPVLEPLFRVAGLKRCSTPIWLWSLEQSQSHR